MSPQDNSPILRIELKEAEAAFSTLQQLARMYANTPYDMYASKGDLPNIQQVASRARTTMMDQVIDGVEPTPTEPPVTWSYNQDLDLYDLTINSPALDQAIRDTHQTITGLKQKLDLSADDDHPEIPVIETGLRINSRQELILYCGQEEFVLHRFQSTDTAPFQILSYILVRQGHLVSKGDITQQLRVNQPGDLTERLRQCGITREIKRICFPVKIKAAVKYEPSTSTSAGQFADLKHRILSDRGQS